MEFVEYQHSDNLELELMLELISTLFPARIAKYR